MKSTLLFTLLLTAFGANSQCSELFFSEYEEGSSSNKAFEIYNPTGSAVNLSDYVIYRANNGSPIATDSLFPVGMLAAGDVFVTANPSASAGILAVADTTHTLTFYNGDDAMWIKKISTGDTLDIIGIIGVDPGSGWPVGTGATNNNTLIRSINIQQGQLNWAIGATEWDVFPINMIDSLGTHSMNACVACVPTSSTVPLSACDSMVSPSGNFVWSASGPYMDTITNALGCDSVMSINLVITNSSAGTDILSACDTHTWIDGTTYNASNTTATFALTNSVGCDSIVTLNLTIWNSVSVPDVQVACDSFMWINGNTYYADNSTATFMLGTTSNGCDSVSTLNLTITIVDATVTNSNPILTANGAGTYQWVDCNNGNSPIMGEMSQSFTATSNGSYAVEVTLNGCTKTSACEVITGLGITENTGIPNAVLYPNPSNGNITVSFGETQNSVELLVTNMKGQLLLTNNYSTANQLSLDLPFENGVYFIQVTNQDGLQTRFRVILN